MTRYIVTINNKRRPLLKLNVLTSFNVMSAEVMYILLDYNNIIHEYDCSCFL